MRRAKKARVLKLFFYREVIPILPSDERFNLGIQCTQGKRECDRKYFGRLLAGTTIENVFTFIAIARGSIYELKDHITTCLDLNLVDKELFNRGIVLIEDSKKTLNGYINFVKNQQRAEDCQIKS